MTLLLSNWICIRAIRVCAVKGHIFLALLKTTLMFFVPHDLGLYVEETREGGDLMIWCDSFLRRSKKSSLSDRAKLCVMASLSLSPGPLVVVTTSVTQLMAREEGLYRSDSFKIFLPFFFIIIHHHQIINHTLPLLPSFTPPF